MASPLLELNSASLGGWVAAAEDGVDVLPGEVVSLRLIDSAGIRLWNLTVIGTDEEITAPAITQAGSISGTATFTVPTPPDDGVALGIQSQVGFLALGEDRYSQPDPTYTTTIGVFVRTGEGLRLGFINEKLEGSAEWGWVIKINELTRRAPATGTGVPTGRTISTTTPIRIDGGASADLSANRTISLIPGTVAGQVLGWDGASWLARQVVVLTGITVSTLGLGVVHSSAGGVFSSSLIVDADVDPAAAIAVSKLAPGANGQAIVTAGGVAVWGTVTAGSIAPGANRQIYVTNATPLGAWATVSGDVSVPTTAGVFRVDAINGTAVTTPGGGAVGSVLRMTGVATCDFGELDLADEDAVDGLLAVTHIAPGTNGQFLGTVGGVTTWTAVPIGSITPGAANTVLTTNAGATATAWTLAVNANIDPAAAIAVTKLAPGGLNYTLITDGTGTIVWSPGVPGTGTLLGDVTGPLATNVVERIHGTTVPAGGALLVGQSLRATGLAASAWGAVDLSNSNAVINALPLANIAQGGAVLNDVMRWNGGVWDPEPIGNLLPPSATAVQIVADMPALELLLVTPLADRILCIVQTPTRLYWLDKGATPAASGDDELPPANGGGAWRFKEAA